MFELYIGVFDHADHDGDVCFSLGLMVSKLASTLELSFYCFLSFFLLLSFLFIVYACVPACVWRARTASHGVPIVFLCVRVHWHGVATASHDHPSCGIFDRVYRLLEASSVETLEMQ
jgi:hypothetical protein